MTVSGLQPRLGQNAARPLESLIDSLASRAHLDEPAFTHVDPSARQTETSDTLTWSGLYARVTAIAARIVAQADGPARVAVLCPQDLTYPVAFFGALASGAVGVPLFAPEAGAHADRLKAALADCQPSIWLTAQATLGAVSELLSDPAIRRPDTLIVVDADDVDLETGAEALPTVDLDATAYLQYTSGSTRAPAGAVISHRAVACNARQVAAAFDVSGQSTCVGWLPFFHDMGLMLLACLPVATGARSVFSTPFDFMRNPRGWLEMMAAHPDVITAAPNFAFDYAVDHVGGEARATLNLSSLRVAICGSEPVQPRTVERFREAFEPCGFAPHAHRPSYGLAEATVFVSASLPTGPTVRRMARSELAAGRAVSADDDVTGIALVSAGRPVGQRVCIVDPVGHTPRPNGEVGEIWVHGPNLGTSYWGQPHESRQAFNGCLAESASGVPTTGWLRSGDLGVYHDGELYVTGRLTDLIKVDGQAHYPEHIEQTVQKAHPAVRPGRVAAFGIPAGAGERIVVVMERTRSAGTADSPSRDISIAVQRAVAAGHGLTLSDVRILKHQKVLRTSSGKIARAANRDRYLTEQAAAAS